VTAATATTIFAKIVTKTATKIAATIATRTVA